MEIERKFLVAGKEWRKFAGKGLPVRQGYIINNKGRTVRIRTLGDKGIITIKGPRRGISRAEYEYEIPYKDANELLENFCSKPLIDKHRYPVFYHGTEWIVDIFHKENQGLVLAEVELESENQYVQLPPWVAEEVSLDNRYYNSSLVRNPYENWQ
ncbi:MAG: CYTH domain-containing protein [Bacteroidetes bacterium]|nr:CYTH domain-containing protein [Bacteroidota bacterium]